MVFIAKVPLNVMEKKQASNTYNVKSRYKGYAYLAVDRGNRIIFYVSLNSKKDSLRIPIARHYLYDMNLFALMFRPVPRQSKADDKLWLNPGVRSLQTEKNFNQMLPDEMHDRFEKALEGLDIAIKESPEKQQIIARQQFDRLVAVQWKADAMYELYCAEKLII